jgi:hypothetical protein
VLAVGDSLRGMFWVQIPIQKPPPTWREIRGPKRARPSCRHSVHDSPKLWSKRLRMQRTCTLRRLGAPERTHEALATSALVGLSPPNWIISCTKHVGMSPSKMEVLCVHRKCWTFGFHFTVATRSHPVQGWQWIVFGADTRGFRVLRVRVCG